MPHFLESGRLQLSHGEAIGYHAAAQRLHKTRETALDLAQPITAEEWIFLELAHAALEGNLGLLPFMWTTTADSMFAKLERLRKL